MRFRKSFKLGGGVRVNLSKSGIGYSWGIPGYRITRTAKGKTRTTTSIPGTGISFSKNISSKTKPESPNFTPPTTQQYFAENPLTDIESTKSLDNINQEYNEIIQRIKTVILLNKISTILILCFMLIFGAVSSSTYIVLGLLLPILGIILKIIVHTKGRIDFKYSFDDYYRDKYRSRILKWIELNKSNKLWQITQERQNDNTKRTAGASKTINRIPIRINKKKPFYFNSETTIIQIKLYKEEIFILPDKILVHKKNDFWLVDYDSVKISEENIRFVESSSVPKDAQIVDYTWQYVNKNGSPDKRFADNRRLPVCLYGEITMISNQGLNVCIECSNSELANNLAQYLIQ